VPFRILIGDMCLGGGRGGFTFKFAGQFDLTDPIRRMAKQPDFVTVMGTSTFVTGDGTTFFGPRLIYIYIYIYICCAKISFVSLKKFESFQQNVNPLSRQRLLAAVRLQTTAVYSCDSCRSGTMRGIYIYNSVASNVYYIGIWSYQHTCHFQRFRHVRLLHPRARMRLQSSEMGD
jgi:hypothetical protein